MQRGSMSGRNLTVYTTMLASLAVLLTFRPPSVAFTEPLLLSFLLLAVITEGVPLPSLYRAVSLSFALSFPAFILQGLGAAVWIIGIGSFLGKFGLSRQGLTAALFNASRSVLGMAVAGFVYTLAGGGADPLLSPNWFALSLVSPAFFAVSLLLDRLATGSFHLDRAQLLLVVSAHIVLTSFGLLLATALVLQGWFAFFLVVVSLGAVIYLMRLHDELQTASNELRILHEMAERLNATLRLDGVFEIVAQAVNGVMGPQFLRLFLFKEGEQGPEITAVRSYGEEADDQVPPVCVTLAMFVGREGKPRLTQDVLRDPELAPLVAEADASEDQVYRSFLAVPLLAEGHLLGVLAAGHQDTRKFTPEHLRLVSIMSTQVAAAIKNAILYEKTENMAITDLLTNLYNYRYFYLRLEDELKKAVTYGSSVSLIYLDLDRFKQCNDCFGHLAGDHILYQFAQVLRQAIRQSDIPARYGGDEFVIILPATGRDEAWEVVSRIKEAVESHPFQIRNRNIVTRIGLSAGIACFPDDAQTVDELVFLADKSMYQDKVAGEDVG